MIGVQNNAADEVLERALGGERDRSRLVDDLSSCFQPGGPLCELAETDEPPAKLGRLRSPTAGEKLPVPDHATVSEMSSCSIPLNTMMSPAEARSTR